MPVVTESVQSQMRRLLPGGRGKKSASVLLRHPSLSRSRPVKVARPPPPFSPFKRVHRRLSHHDKLQIIYWRFGALDRVDGRAYLSYNQLVQRLRVPYSTLKYVIDKFKRSGFQLSSLERVRGRFRDMPARVKERLLSPALLQKWAPHTIGERVQAIRQAFGHQISKTGLQRFYHAHGVKYRDVKRRFKHCLAKQPHLSAERQKMAVLLGSLLCSDSPIIYMDETSVRAQDCPRRSWATRSDPSVHYVDNDGSLSITVFGAIGTCIPPTFMLADSTNAQDYKKFVRLVAGKVPPDVRKPLWFFDGHAAHARRESVQYAANYFRLIQSVPYSSEFNSIEYVWGLFKRDVRRKLVLTQGALCQATFNELVRASLGAIPAATIRNVLRSNHRYLRGLLAQQCRGEPEEEAKSEARS